MARAGTKKWARKKFKRYIKYKCPTCGAKVGKLCNTPTVWVHLSRFFVADFMEEVEGLNAAQEEV